MQDNTENDIDQHITTLLTDILAPTNYAELKGVLKTVELLTDYVQLENVRTILEDDVLFRENRDVAVMALDILRKMHDNEQDPEHDACEPEVVDAVNEALGEAEPETIPLDVGSVAAVAEPETTPEPAEVKTTTIKATETQPEQASDETQKIDAITEIPVSSHAVPEDSEVTNTTGDSADPIDIRTTEPEPEPVAKGSGFPGLPDDGGLSDSADPTDETALEPESMHLTDSPELHEDPETIPLSKNMGDVDAVAAVAEPETTPEPAEVKTTETQPEQASDETQKIDAITEIPVSSHAVPEDSEVTNTTGDSADPIDIRTTELEPEPVADGSGFPGLPDDEGLSDSADLMGGGTPELEPAPADFPGLTEDSNIPDTGGDSADPIDSPTTELEPAPEPMVDGSGFPGFPDDDELSDSADPGDTEAFGLESEPESPVDFPGLSEDSDISAQGDMAGSPFDDDPDQMPAFPDDGAGAGDMSGLPEPAESKAGGELENQWKQTVQRIKELKTRYVTK